MPDDQANNSQPPAQDEQPRFSLRGQYVKDLSMENPHAPESLYAGNEQPKVDLNLDLQARQVQEQLYELSMVFHVKGESDKTLFVLDLTYAGLFELVNIPGEAIERVLLVDCAFSLFPFARRIVSDITRDSGFPPLILEPIDFMNLYERRKQQEQQQLPNEGQAGSGDIASSPTAGEA